MPDKPQPDPFVAWWKAWSSEWKSPPGVREEEIAGLAWDKGYECGQAERDALLEKVRKIRERTYPGVVAAEVARSVCDEMLEVAKRVECRESALDILHRAEAGRDAVAEAEAKRGINYDAVEGGGA